MLLKGKKTAIFWIGLVILGGAVVALFWTIWYLTMIMPSFSWSARELSIYIANQWKNFTPMIFGTIVFMLIGLYMMLSGIKKDANTMA